MASLSYRARFSWDHRWLPGHASEYLDGELTPRGRLRVERHVRDCEECRRLLAGLRGVLDGLRRLPAPVGGADPRQIAASVRRRLHEPRGD
ncbi:MAG TPA: anti-sigma factor [Solirubrobacteraceae bacterium]|jgi:anti-sigma factor RsiW|nr:anti-sigma factor [Solirubrobacteraceae bacterium]